MLFEIAVGIFHFFAKCVKNIGWMIKSHVLIFVYFAVSTFSYGCGGRIRTDDLLGMSQVRLPLLHSALTGVPDRSRTYTGRSLNPVPLPIGLQEQLVIPVGFEPTPPGLRVRCPTVRRENHMELPVGFEPTVHCLQGSCVTVSLQELMVLHKRIELLYPV